MNVEALREYCTFGDERVYLLMAIAREKDQPGGVDADGPVIREVVAGPEDLARTVRQLEHAVARFEARCRLYLTASARNVLDATFALRRRTDRWLRELVGGDGGATRRFKRLDSEFTSALHAEDCRDETTFLFDVDDATPAGMRALREALDTHTTVRLTRETPNGYHLVTEPFDYTALETDTEFELKTDGMVFLRFLDG
jgi:hypothetical protein